MNIFYTNSDPVQCAREHCVVHRTKMIVETAQLLSTAHHVLDGELAPSGLYKPTHRNHPSAVWVRKSKAHYNWAWQLLRELCRLHYKHKGVAHKTTSLLSLLENAPKNILDVGFKAPPVAAPDAFAAIAIFEGAEVAYQKYLCAKFNEWASRPKPIIASFADGVPSWLQVEFRYKVV